MAALIDKPIWKYIEHVATKRSARECGSEIRDRAINKRCPAIDAEIVKLDYRNPMTRERVQDAFMREISTVLVLSDDWPGNYQCLATMLASDFLKEGLLSGC
jgi:hypothetical protein